MARATHDFNSPDCTCGNDHNALDYIVAALMQAAERGEVTFQDEWEFGAYVLEHARAVGWVQAGDELEDLRQLTMGMTGLDQVEDAVPDKVVKTIDTRHATPMGLAYNAGSLYVGRFPGDPVATEPDIKYVVHLNRQQRTDLANLMLADESETGE